VLAVNLGVADVPLWLLIGAGVLAVGIAGWRWLHSASALEEFASESESGRLAIPYYVERDGLRSLAASFKVELPTTREVTKQRKFMARIRGVGGERGQSETKQFSGEIDLRELVRKFEETLDYDSCARDLGDAPAVEDREVLSDAIAHLNRTVGETSQTRELLGRVEEVYDRERSETIVKQKRTELREVGDREKLILMRGRFETAEKPGSGNALIVITHFEPPLHYRDYGGVRGIDAEPPQPVPVPPGVGIRIALPDDSAFTPAGKERIGRGEPFYARLIAHSPSYNEDTGMLSCAAYALWGTNRPRSNPDYYAC
jgi:hypothetical protein